MAEGGRMASDQIAWPSTERLSNHWDWRPDWTPSRPCLYWYLTFDSGQLTAAVGPGELHRLLVRGQAVVREQHHGVELPRAHGRQVRLERDFGLGVRQLDGPQVHVPQRAKARALC